MTPWTQIYNPLGSILLSALVAALPVATMLVALAFLRVAAHLAALAALAVALAVAALVFGMPAEWRAGRRCSGGPACSRSAGSC